MNSNELLKAYFEPLIRKMVEEEVKLKLAEIRLKTEPERPILIGEAAQILGYSVSHIYTLCKQNKIPFVKKGRWLHFYVSKLNEWLKS